jgi:hypothetical protein
LANPIRMSAAASGGPAAASAMPNSNVTRSRMISLLSKTPPPDGPPVKSPRSRPIASSHAPRLPRPDHPVAGLRPA